METQPMANGVPKTPEENKPTKKLMDSLAFQSLAVVILAIVIQFATFNSALIFELILFVAGIGLAIAAIRKIKKTGGRGKIMAIISLVLGLLGLFNVVSGFVVNSRIN